MNPNIKHIIVLGNGFDLHCGLKSSFGDYLITKKPTIKWPVPRDGWKDFNLWSFLLYCRGNHDIKVKEDSSGYFTFRYDPIVRWTDVEANVLDALKILRNEGEIGLWSNMENPSTATDFFSRKDALAIIEYNLQGMRNYEGPYEMFYGELRLFEKDFSRYLKEEINNQWAQYKENAEKTLASIGGQYSSEKFIISFNYTCPFSSFIPSDQFMPVHGSIDNESSIIGIDITEAENLGGKSLRFSKARRKLELDFNKVSLPPKNNILDISFFGHSLGKADYSYFITLFDHYDVLNSKIALVFYFSKFAKTESENEEIHNKYINDIYSLLKYYCEGRGQNFSFIITKLLLEGRLIIKPISSNV